MMPWEALDYRLRPQGGPLQSLTLQMGSGGLRDSGGAGPCREQGAGSTTWSLAWLSLCLGASGVADGSAEGHGAQWK